MADIPQDLVDRMMVKCHRRCCICRRFRPTRLQVHHIVERGKGGSDDEDNLIVTCSTCHTDIHSKVPFARRFTLGELKGHRDSLIAMLAAGRLPDDPTDDAAMIRHVVELVGANEALSPAAVEILLSAAFATGTMQGMIFTPNDLVIGTIDAGGRQFPEAPDDRRAFAKYKAGLKQLEKLDLVEYQSDELQELTEQGYLRADEIAAELGGSGMLP